MTYCVDVLYLDRMSSVYLIFGEDEFQVSAKAREIVSDMLPEEDRTLGLEVIDGRADSIEAAVRALKQCFESIQTMNFFAKQKVVWFQDVSFLSENVTGKSDGVKPLVDELAGQIESGIMKGIVLIVTAPKVSKKFKFYKACQSVAEIHEFEVSDKSWQNEKDTAEFLRKTLEVKNLKMSKAVGSAFLEKVGINSRQIANEVDKLAVYVGDRGDVKMDDIEAVTSSSRSAVSWDLADAIGRRDLGKALVILRQLLFQRESTIGIIMGLNSRIRELMVYRQALDKGWLTVSGGGDYKKVQWVQVPADIEEMFSEQMSKDPRKTHPFRIKLLAGQAEKFSVRDLVKCRKAIIEAYEAIVRSSRPDDLTLELMLVKMLAGG